MLERPVTGTRQVGNVSTIAGNTHPYRWGTGHLDTTDTGNVAGGPPRGRLTALSSPEMTRYRRGTEFLTSMLDLG